MATIKDKKTFYTLYLKTHKDTGFKYLGVTRQNPFNYNGSGKLWKQHLEKHGYNIETEVIGVYDNKESLREAGIKYSNEYNIVESKEFANLTIEEGQGGDTWDKRGRIISKKTREKMSKSHKGLKKSKEHQEKIVAKLIEHNKRERTPEEKEMLSIKQKMTRCKCDYCDFESTMSHVKRHMKREHGECNG